MQLLFFYFYLAISLVSLSLTSTHTMRELRHTRTKEEEDQGFAVRLSLGVHKRYIVSHCPQALFFRSTHTSF
jgi:hypothetical protein